VACKKKGPAALGADCAPAHALTVLSKARLQSQAQLLPVNQPVLAHVRSKEGCCALRLQGAARDKARRVGVCGLGDRLPHQERRKRLDDAQQGRRLGASSFLLHFVRACQLRAVCARTRRRRLAEKHTPSHMCVNLCVKQAASLFFHAAPLLHSDQT
jgi:hypothetical protein